MNKIGFERVNYAFEVIRENQRNVVTGSYGVFD